MKMVFVSNRKDCRDMESNQIQSLIAALVGVNLASVASYVPLAIAVSAILAAILPQPNVNSPWVPVRKLIDLLAMNIGSAKNATEISSATASHSSSLGVLVAFGCTLSLVACSAAQNAQFVSDVQSANAIAVQDARLFCAVATPTGPLVVALADSAGAPVVATGTAATVVKAACGAISGIPVSPPNVGAVVPTVAASVPDGTPTRS